MRLLTPTMEVDAEGDRTRSMREIRQIVRLWREDTATVLVTLVRTEGSSYRRPGARLLLGKQGEYAGTISGGCLEAEVMGKGAWLVWDGAGVGGVSRVFVVR